MTATASPLELESSSSSIVPPAWATERNELRPTYGHAVIAAAALLGKPLMPWQAYVVLVALEVQSEEAGDPSPGEWAYDEIGITVQRQAGKTYLLRPVLIHRLRSISRARCWSTAQTGVHARRRWLDLSEALLVSPVGGDLRRKTGAGHEELKLLETLSTLEPFAPNGDSLHGETPDLVLIDELWAFDAEQWHDLEQAYEPGFTTKDGQAWKLSTAGTAASSALNSLRRRGRAAVEAGRQLGLAWFEWCVPDEIDGIPIEQLDDKALVDAVIRFHPARGYTLREQSVRRAFEKMTEHDYATGRDGFLRAYGNRSQGSGRTRSIEAAVWRRARTPLRIPVGRRICLGVHVDDEGLETSLVSGVRLEDGRGLVEAVDVREGVTWAADRVVEILGRNPDVASVAIADSGPGRDLADVLEARGVQLVRVHRPDYAAACVRFDRELREKVSPLALHRGQAVLDEAAGTVVRERIGSSWGWARPKDAPCTAVVAATLALWGVDHTPDPEPEGRFAIG